MLRRLSYVDGEGVVSVKGRLAAGLSCGDELVLCELVFAGAFNAMSLEGLAATCSCFVWQEKGGEGGGPKVRESIGGGGAVVEGGVSSTGVLRTAGAAAVSRAGNAASTLRFHTSVSSCLQR